MRRIKQKDKTGCGLACLAMLSGKKYEEARAVAVGKLQYDENEGDYYTGTRELVTLGKLLHIEVGTRRRQFKAWDQLSPLAIVAINHSEATDIWHWVVYDGRTNSPFVLDPKPEIKANRRTDFGRMNPRWWLPVHLHRTTA